MRKGEVREERTGLEKEMIVGMRGRGRIDHMIVDWEEIGGEGNEKLRMRKEE